MSWYDFIALISVIGFFIINIGLFVLVLAASYFIGVYFANYFQFNGLIYWGCVLLVMLILLSLTNTVRMKLG